MKVPLNKSVLLTLNMDGSISEYPDFVFIPFVQRDCFQSNGRG